MTRTKTEMKAERDAEAAAQAKYASLLQQKPIRVREEDVQRLGIYSIFRDATGQNYYLCTLYPPTKDLAIARIFPRENAWQWRVACSGTDGNYYLVRRCRSEEEARRVYENVRDWATIKRLKNLGFRRCDSIWY